MRYKLFAILFGVLLLNACSPRNLVYLSDVQGQEEYIAAIAAVPVPKIQPGDLLSITVTSISPEANTLFNAGVMPSGSVGAAGASESSAGFLVNQDGFIDYPVLGQLKVGGLTKEEMKAKLIDQLQPYLNDPIVRIRYINYRITVVGEVNNPSTFNIPSEKINLIEALGMAGDMTAFGKRENVLVMREEDGVRKMKRLDMNKADFLNSTYFYLQPNDIIYVEPDKAKAAQASATRSNVTFALSIISVAAVLLTRFL